MGISYLNLIYKYQHILSIRKLQAKAISQNPKINSGLPNISITIITHRNPGKLNPI
jgi:hypothetical protein